MIFDFKIYFDWRVRFVVNSYIYTYPQQSTYADIVYVYTVIIALTYAALYRLSVMTVDIHNAFLQVPVSMKCCVLLGPEFGL